MQAQTANRLDGCWVKFCVTKCTNLKNKKGFLNRKVNFMLPDPYVSVRLQKKRLGRTSTRPNTLNPVWTNKNDKETFTLKNVPTYAKETQGTSASEYVVTLNVFDDDVGRDRPMGSATMHWEELMCEGEHCLKMHGQRNDAYHKREMHFLKFHKSVTRRGFLQFLNFNFGKMASPRGHATSTQSLGPSESLRSVATPSFDAGRAWRNM